MSIKSRYVDLGPFCHILGCEPGPVVLRSGQQQFVELPPTEYDGHMLPRFCPKPGHDKPGFIFLAGPAVGGEEVIGSGGDRQLHHPGQTLPVRTGLPIPGQLLGRCTAQMLIERFLLSLLLILLHPHVQGAGGGLLGQSQKFRHINVYIDIVRIAASFRLSSVRTAR